MVLLKSREHLSIEIASNEGMELWLDKSNAKGGYDKAESPCLGGYQFPKSFYPSITEIHKSLYIINELPQISIQ